MLEYKEHADSATVELTVQGHITTTDFDAMADKLEAFIKRYKQIRLLQVIKDFEGIDPTLLWRDMGFAFRHMNSFSRCAVVTDTAWIKWWSMMVSPFIRCEVKEFALNELSQARSWLQQGEQKQKKAA